MGTATRVLVRRHAAFVLLSLKIPPFCHFLGFTYFFIILNRLALRSIGLRYTLKPCVSCQGCLGDIYYYLKLLP